MVFRGDKILATLYIPPFIKRLVFGAAFAVICCYGTKFIVVNGILKPSASSCQPLQLT